MNYKTRYGIDVGSLILESMMEMHENNLSKAIRECITILGRETILKLIDETDNKKDFIKKDESNIFVSC